MMAKTISFAFAIALPLLLVRRLSQQDLGLYKQAFFVVTTAMNLLPLGFALSAFYFLPREPARQPAVIANILAFLAGMGGCAARVPTRCRSGCPRWSSSCRTPSTTCSSATPSDRPAMPSTRSV